MNLKPDPAKIGSEKKKANIAVVRGTSNNSKRIAFGNKDVSDYWKTGASFVAFGLLTIKAYKWIKNKVGDKDND